MQPGGEVAWRISARLQDSGGDTPTEQEWGHSAVPGRAAPPQIIGAGQPHIRDRAVGKTQIPVRLILEPLMCSSDDPASKTFLSRPAA